MLWAIYKDHISKFPVAKWACWKLPDTSADYKVCLRTIYDHVGNPYVIINTSVVNP